MAETAAGVTIPVQGAPVAQPAQQTAPAAASGLSPDVLAAIQAATRPAVPEKPVTPTAPVAVFNPNTGDSVIDFTVQAFAKANGITQDVYNSSIAEAVRTGDMSRLDLAGIIRAGGADAAAAATELVKAMSQHNSTKNQSNADFVHKAAGGKEFWTAAVTHINNSEPDFVKQQYLGMLESGNPEQMQYAVNQIMQKAKAAGVIQNVLPIQPGSGAPSAAQGLSAQEFTKALADLQKQYPNRSLESGPAGQAYQELLARRRLGAGAGR